MHKPFLTQANNVPFQLHRDLMVEIRNASFRFGIKKAAQGELSDFHGFNLKYLTSRSDEFVDQILKKLLSSTVVACDSALIEDVFLQIFEAGFAFFNLLTNA